MSPLLPQNTLLPKPPPPPLPSNPPFPPGRSHLLTSTFLSYSPFLRELVADISALTIAKLSCFHFSGCIGGARPKTGGGYAGPLCTLLPLQWGGVELRGSHSFLGQH